MPGKRITQHQESLYMSARQSGKSQETAAAKAAISERSGRRIEKGERLSISGERHWRTREDPFEAIWKNELVPLLENEAQLFILKPVSIGVDALIIAILSIAWLFRREDWNEAQEVNFQFLTS